MKCRPPKPFHERCGPASACRPVAGGRPRGRLISSVLGRQAPRSHRGPKCPVSGRRSVGSSRLRPHRGDVVRFPGRGAGSRPAPDGPFSQRLHLPLGRGSGGGDRIGAGGTSLGSGPVRAGRHPVDRNRCPAPLRGPERGGSGIRHHPVLALRSIGTPGPVAPLPRIASSPSVAFARCAADAPSFGIPPVGPDQPTHFDRGAHGEREDVLARHVPHRPSISFAPRSPSGNRGGCRSDGNSQTTVSEGTLGVGRRKRGGIPTGVRSRVSLVPRGGASPSRRARVRGRNVRRGESARGPLAKRLIP